MQLPGGAPQVFMRTSGSAVANESLSGKDLVFGQEDSVPPARGVNFNMLMILLVLRMLLLHVLGGRSHSKHSKGNTYALPPSVHSLVPAQMVPQLPDQIAGILMGSHKGRGDSGS